MPGKRRQLTVGVDVGGTFTDIIVLGSKGLSILKLPTSSDPSSAVLDGLRRLGSIGRNASLIGHATTLATNALLTFSDLGRTALITNEGFRDILEIGRQRRPDLYDLRTRRPPPLIERRDRLTVRCRVAADGSVLEPLGEEDAESLAQQVVKGGYQSVAVAFLNSYLNDSHERQVRDALLKKGFQGHVSLSSGVDRAYREYERTSTTVVNAVLSPLISGYLNDLVSALRHSRISAPVYVMGSDGGASTIAFASAHPAYLVESGPAAGVVASKVLARKLSLKKVLTFDMGGTTAKAGTVMGGEPDIVSEFEAAGRTHSGRSIKGSGYAIRGQFIDLAEVSAGGGTVAWLDEAGELKVGPRSAGSHPGPACYGRGGMEPTVTDANVVLGRLNPKALLGGSLKIKRELAVRSFGDIAHTVGRTIEDCSKSVLRLVNDSMARALFLVSRERGRDPRDFTMFAFGGAGPMHACDLAEELGVREIRVPMHAGLFSAYGLLAGELTRHFDAPIMKSEKGLSREFTRLEQAARQELRREGLERFRMSRRLRARYAGQSHELQLPYHSDAHVRKSFDAKHKALYGYSTSDNLEVVNITVTATVPRLSVGMPKADDAIRKVGPTQRVAWVGGQTRTLMVLVGESLPPGSRGRGPSIVEEYDSTLVVNPSWRWRKDDECMRLSR